MWQKIISVSLPTRSLHPNSFLIATDDDKTRQKSSFNFLLNYFPITKQTSAKGFAVSGYSVSVHQHEYLFDKGKARF